MMVTQRSTHTHTHRTAGGSTDRRPPALLEARRSRCARSRADCAARGSRWRHSPIAASRSRAAARPERRRERSRRRRTAPEPRGGAREAVTLGALAKTGCRVESEDVPPSRVRLSRISNQRHVGEEGSGAPARGAGRGAARSASRWRSTVGTRPSSTAAVLALFEQQARSDQVLGAVGSVVVRVVEQRETPVRVVDRRSRPGCSPRRRGAAPRRARAR